MRFAGWLGVAMVALAAGGAPAQAQKSADTLRVSWRDAIPNVDPYYNSLRTGLVLAHQAWDCLIYRDPDTFQMKPLLATSWRYVDPTTIEFSLRHDVTFHNGDPFSADDVVYTVNTILNDKQVAVPSNFSFIAGADKVDDYTVRIRLKRVFPAALEYVSMVLPIWPKAYREKVGADAYARAPIGAGPYRITKVDGTTEIDMERYEGYYKGSAKGRPAIGKFVIHEVSDATTELNELLGGRTDWIWNFISDNFDNINRVPTLQALRAESMRVIYLNMDAAGRTGAGNPLTKKLVRQAIAMAIDRKAMATNLMQGGSRVPDAPCFPTQFGCDAAAAVHYDYDPAKAKALLTEAGYPNGFDTDINSSQLPQFGGAIQNYLKAIGINAHLSQLQSGAAVQRSLDGKAQLDLNSWGSYSINDVSAFMPYFFTGSPSDYARDPELQKQVTEGGATTDPDQRLRHYSQAIKIITENMYFLPLMTSVVNYGFSRQLNFKPYPDELPRFFLSSWK